MARRPKREALVLLLVVFAAAPIGCRGPQGLLGAVDPLAYPSLEPEQWLEVRSGPLSLYSNAPEEVVRKLAKDLSRLQGLLARLTALPLAEDPPPARIFVFASPLGYRFFQAEPTAGAFFSYLPQGPTIVTTAGLRRTITTERHLIFVPGFSPAEASRRLFHEYVHLLLHTRSRVLHPRWYDEGVAELVSSARLRGDEVELGTVPPSGDPGALSMIDVLTVRDYHPFSDERRESFYTRSRALVQMLVGGHMLGFPDRRDALVHYVELLNEGHTEREACRRAFAVGPDELGRELDAFLESGLLPAWRIDAEVLDVTEPDGVRRLSAAEGYLLLGELAAELQGVDSDLSEALLRAGLLRDPGDARLLAWRAYGEEVEGRPAESDAYVARADAAGGGPEVDRLVARTLLHRADHAEAATGRWALIGRARQRLERSLLAQPQSVEGNVLLGQSYLLSADEEEDPADGIIALERAVDAMPFQTSLYLGLAELHRRAAQWALARERVDLVLQWSGVPEELAMARQLSAAIALGEIADGPDQASGS